MQSGTAVGLRNPPCSKEASMPTCLALGFSSPCTTKRLGRSEGSGGGFRTSVGAMCHRSRGCRAHLFRSLPRSVDTCGAEVAPTTPSDTTSLTEHLSSRLWHAAHRNKHCWANVQPLIPATATSPRGIATQRMPPKMSGETGWTIQSQVTRVLALACPALRHYVTADADFKKLGLDSCLLGWLKLIWVVQTLCNVASPPPPSQGKGCAQQARSGYGQAPRSREHLGLARAPGLLAPRTPLRTHPTESATPSGQPGGAATRPPPPYRRRCRPSPAPHLGWRWRPLGLGLLAASCAGPWGRRATPLDASRSAPTRQARRRTGGRSH